MSLVGPSKVAEKRPHVKHDVFKLLIRSLGYISRMNRSPPTFALLGFCLGIFVVTGENRFLFVLTCGLGLGSLFVQSRSALLFGAGILLAIARVAVAGQNAAPVQPETVTGVQTWAVARIDAAVPYPASALTAGILFGLRTDMPKALTDSMSAAGLSHMLAVSGFNVTIVALVVGRVAANLFNKRARVVITILIVALYVLLCGAGPPVVRAGIMGGIASIVLSTGRATSARRILLVAATLLIIWDPYVLRFDVGFQLSVAATFGLLAIGPQLQKLAEHFPNPIGMRDAATTSIAASLATLPVVISTFGVVPLYGIAANILAAPLSPLLMACGSVALAGGDTAVGQFAGTVTAYLSQLLTGIAATAARLPHAAIELSGSTGWVIVGTALVVLLLAMQTKRFIHKRRANRPLLL